MLSLYAKFIVRHSYIVLFTVTVFSTIFTLIPLLCHKLPSFSDPLAGFETRGTSLAQRFISWENLMDETRPSKRLAVDPKEIEDQLRMNRTYHNKIKEGTVRSTNHSKKKGKKKNERHNTSVDEKILFPESENSPTMNHVHWGYGINVSFENENAVFLRNLTRKQWLSLKRLHRKPDNSRNYNYASSLCGSPLVNYAHLVVESIDNSSLLSFENIMKVCHFQSYLVSLSGKEYRKFCQRLPHSKDVCCPLWSLPNYIALMSSKTTCENLTRDDVSMSIVILKECAGYFHNFSLMSSCELGRCKVPKHCTQHDAVYNILFYLIDIDAFSPIDLVQSFVKNALIFLPLSRSSTILPYYRKLEMSNMSYDNLIIPAMDFGLKNALFDLWIIQDTWLVGLGGVFVFLFVLIYTKSLILTVLLFTAILYSLGVAYFIYIYVLNLDFFPFMNILVIVVLIGIGADDAFLYIKVWKMAGKQLLKDNVIVHQQNGLTDVNNISSAGETILIQILEETLKHSILPIFITALTTSVAFFASYISYIPAINCFSVFAGIAVLINFFLMITWLPVCVFIVDVKLFQTKSIFIVVYKLFNVIGEDLKVVLNRFVIICVTKLHILFVILMGVIGIFSIIVVFYKPGLQLPDSKQFQLFQTSHPFEQYDLKYRDKFLFERYANDIGIGSKMPLRWIWGIKATDNGNHMNPYSKGYLVFDETFSISDPKAQLWLINFCAKLKSQSFYQPTLGPLLPNCFIETFKLFMSRKCFDSISKFNRTPCCESSQFPYESEVFEFCIIQAMESLYQTPRELFIPGVAGPKFLRGSSPSKIAAVVVEFESVIPYSMSYTEMNAFFHNVENWTQYELKSAPQSLKSGWFLSDLQFYDLQYTLITGTVTALALSAGLGFVVLIPSTSFSFVVSVCALTAMIFSATVTIAILVLYGWKLNVLESVAISTSAGLAVDFSLHYALNFSNANGNNRSRVTFALNKSAGPTAAAGVTTGFAGIFLLKSNLLPYSQIGIFLILIISVSWLYATFFLCSLLCIFDCSDPKGSSPEERKKLSRVSSVCSGVPNLESHELEHLADSNNTNLTHSHSPSSVSATTVILHDNYECSNLENQNMLVVEQD